MQEPRSAPEDRSRPGAQAGPRTRRSAERRNAILAAALDEFSARGFAATRLDDVAARAGVAKGTIYLHFADKEALFQELILHELNPVVGALHSASLAERPLREIADAMIEVFVREIFGTRRKDVIRLVIAEGPRFPVLAESHFRNVLAPVLAAVRGVLKRALARGELSDDALLRFPQLLVAPGIVAILWSGLFDRFEPLDPRALMRAQFDMILSGGRTR